MDKWFERIRQKRIEIGMTQNELSRRAGYTDHTSMNKIEKGLVDIPISRLEKIAEILDVSPVWLLGWEDKDED